MRQGPSKYEFEGPCCGRGAPAVQLPGRVAAGWRPLRFCGRLPDHRCGPRPDGQSLAHQRRHASRRRLPFGV